MTKHYDIYGNPTSPQGRKSGGAASVALGLVVCAAIAVACLFFVFVANRAKPKADTKQQEQQAKPKGPTHDSMCVTYTYDGEAIRYYVMTDPDTQRQYIVNDRGGMCLREPYEPREKKVERHDDGTITYEDSEEVTE